MLLASLLFLSTPVECPQWLPGTDIILPAGTYLTREQKVKNLLRCYCEIVKQREISCLENHSPEYCANKTSAWFRHNVMPMIIPNTVAIPPNRQVRMLSIEP